MDRMVGRVLLVAAAAPLWIWLRTRSVMDVLPRSLEVATGRLVLLAILAVVGWTAWRLAKPHAAAALGTTRRRVAFGGSVFLLLALQSVLSGAVVRGSGLRVEQAYGPLVQWPLLQVPLLGGFVLRLGSGHAMVSLLLSLLLAGAIFLAWRNEHRAAPAAGAPAVLLSAACPACLPPLLVLAAAGGWTVPATRLVDPALPASALLLVAGLVFALLALVLAVRGRVAPPPRPVRAAPMMAAAPLVVFSGLPRGASPQQQGIHDVFLAALIGAILLTAVVFIWLLVYVVRYRERDEAPEGQEVGKVPRRVLIGLFLAVPALIVFGIGLYSNAVLTDMEDPPDDALQVDVVAGQFAWEFFYPDGTKTTHTLYVPEGQAVHVDVVTKDVVHSFFIPEMGVKIDAVPGTVNSYSFSPERTGSFQGYCAEHCGAGHSEMLFTLTIFPPGYAPPYEEA